MSGSSERQQFGDRPAVNQTVMSRPARIFLAAELVLGATYFLLPDSLLRAAVYCTRGLGMVAAVVVGVRLYRPSRPLAWYLPAASQLSFTVPGLGLPFLSLTVLWLGHRRLVPT